MQPSRRVNEGRTTPKVIASATHNGKSVSSKFLMDAPPPVPPAPECAPTEPSSLTDRLTNVIAAPGEVFTEIKHTPVQTANWLVPLLLVCLAGVFYGVMALSQPGVLRGIEDTREKAMQKQVAAKKITQAQADQASAIAERFMTPAVLKIFGAGGAICASVGGLFLMALALWLALKAATAASLRYMKVVEVCGLALMIDLPQKIIRTWLVTWKENMFVTLSPTLFVAHPDMHNRTDVLLSMFDLIDFWWLAVLSLGLCKVASIPYRTAAFIAFGLWFGFRIVTALLTLMQ
jgi:hypothetical protein